MISEFFYIMSELKKTPRKGWKEKAGIERPESVADHSYGVAVMAMVFSDIENLDTAKAMKMALLHDLAESVTGDFMPGEVSKENKREAEVEAMGEILANLPSGLVTPYTNIWVEYLEGKTREAILLHEIDKLEMALQAAKYFGEGIPIEKLDEFIKSARAEIKSQDLLSVLDSL